MTEARGDTATDVDSREKSRAIGEEPSFARGQRDLGDNREPTPTSLVMQTSTASHEEGRP